MGGATLLTVIRLVLHAHYEPFRDPMDNLFDYKTYIGTSLISFGGMILLSLEVSKEFAMSKKDEVGIQFAEEAIVVVSTILDVAAWMVVVVFALFFINLVISQNKTASALVTRIDGYFRRCCHRCCRCRRRRRRRQASTTTSTEMVNIDETGFFSATRMRGLKSLQPSTVAAEGGMEMGTTNPMYGGARMARTMTQEARDAAHEALGGVQLNTLTVADIDAQLNLSLGTPTPTLTLSLSDMPEDDNFGVMPEDDDFGIDVSSERKAAGGDSGDADAEIGTTEAVVFSHAVFRDADKNGDGSLTKTEIRKYFKTHPIEKAHILGPDFKWKEFFVRMDQDGDAQFDIDEFTEAVSKVYHHELFTESKAEAEALRVAMEESSFVSESHSNGDEAGARGPGKGGEVSLRKVLGRATVENGGRGGSPHFDRSLINVAPATPRESKGCDGDEATGGGIAARNKDFFQHQRKQKELADAEAAQEKHAAQSQLSPKARQESEKAENAAEEHDRAKNTMLREQMQTYKAEGGRGQGGARGGGRGRGRGRGGHGNFATSSNRSVMSRVATGAAGATEATGEESGANGIGGPACASASLDMIPYSNENADGEDGDMPAVTAATMTTRVSSRTESVAL